MNLAVVGSREWSDKAIVERAIHDVWQVITDLDDVLTVVSGGARGVDSMAGNWATANRVALTEYLPDWRPNGIFDRAAGFKRNKLIIRDADLVLAFRCQGSRGTQLSIDIANQMGIALIVWEED